MTDLMWMAVCGLSMAAMGAVYLIDRHRWRQKAHLLGLQAQAATMGLQHARRVRKLQVRRYMDDANAFYAQKQAAEGDDMDWGRPVTVGDPEVDPLCAELSFCGPRHVAVYMRVTDRSVKSSFIQILPSHDGDRVTVYDGRGPILDVYEGVGFAQAANVEKIVDAVRRHNRSFHQEKGGENAGVI
jgi:hypothetical protein